MSITAFLNKFIKSVLYRMHARGVNKAFKKNKEIRALVGSNAEFKDIHKGQRCFIVGNGPSLNDEDLSLLENEYVFTVNKIKDGNVKEYQYAYVYIGQEPHRVRWYKG